MADKFYPIRIRRTSRAYSDIEGSEYSKIQDFIPEYGEPVFNRADSTLQLGDGSAQLKNIKLIKFFSRAKAKLQAFFRDSIPRNTATNFKMYTLTDISENSDNDIYLYTKCWTPEDSQGIPKDAQGRECKITSLSNGGEWFWYDAEGNEVPITDDTTLPRAQKVPVSGISSNMRVGIRLAYSNADRSTSISAKDKQKLGNMMSEVESYNGGIIVIFTSKVPTNNFYLMVFGG